MYVRPRPARGQVGRLMGRPGSSQDAPRKPSHRQIPLRNINDLHLLLSYHVAEKGFNALKTTWPLLSSTLVGESSGPGSNRRLRRPPQQLNCQIRLHIHAAPPTHNYRAKPELLGTISQHCHYFLQHCHYFVSKIRRSFGFILCVRWLMPRSEVCQ